MLFLSDIVLELFYNVGFDIFFAANNILPFICLQIILS